MLGIVARDMTLMFGNVAVPFLFPQPLLMLVALIPVVGVEMLTLRTRISVTFSQVFVANLMSTLVGLPLAFLSILGFNMLLTWHAGPWWTVGLTSHIPIDDFNAWWILTSAMVAVLVPCFVLSVYLEGYYLRSRTSAPAGRPFWFAVVRAHCYSYLVLLALDCLWIAIKIW